MSDLNIDDAAGCTLPFPHSGKKQAGPEHVANGAENE